LWNRRGREQLLLQLVWQWWTLLKLCRVKMWVLLRRCSWGLWRSWEWHQTRRREWQKRSGTADDAATATRLLLEESGRRRPERRASTFRTNEWPHALLLQCPGRVHSRRLAEHIRYS
jgi:hypothetical protein